MTLLFFMGNETQNEMNYRLLRKRFEIENEFESANERLDGNGKLKYCELGNEHLLYLTNENERVRLFENETITPIENENGIIIGFGIGNKLEHRNGNEKQFENEIIFKNEMVNETGNESMNENETCFGFENGNEVGIGNENKFGNENGNGFGNGNEQPNGNEQSLFRGNGLVSIVSNYLMKLFK